MSGNEPAPTSFWTTAPGILTAIAAVVTAVGGLVTALALTGVFGPGDAGGAATGAVETGPSATPSAPSPSPNQAVPGAILLASFEQDEEGWGPQPGSNATGTTTRVSDFHTDGSYALAVDVGVEGWFGTEFGTPQDISGRTSVRADVETVRGDIRTVLAIQLMVGHEFIWCRSPTVDAKGSVALDLATMRCSNPNGDHVDRPSDLTQLTQVWLYFNPGSFRVDNVLAE